VRTHLGHLFEKLGVTSRTKAVTIATRRGLVRMD
jgi:DNA-binding CsgD family transcriptional regulator